MSRTQRGQTGWGEYVKARARERSMGNGRLVGSAVALGIGAALVYTSLFYAPAFIPGSSFGEQRLTVSPPEQPSTIEKYTSLLLSPRGYVAAGTTLQGQYSFNAPTTAEFTLMRCTTGRVIEVYRCKAEAVVMQKSKGQQGTLTFTPTETGFYQIRVKFTDEVPAHSVVWARS